MSSVVHVVPRPAREMCQQAQQATRRKHHHQHDKAAHPELPVLAQIDAAHRRQVLENMQHVLKCKSPHNRARKVAHAAQNHHHDAVRDAKAALATWKRLSVADPNNIDAFVQVANLSINAGDAQGAVAALETAVAADPQNARVLQILGDIQQQAGKTDEALKHYTAAAKLDSKDLVTRLKIGEILIDSHRGAEALGMAGEMLKEDASNRFGLDLKARALKELRRVDEALVIAESLSASDPKDLKAAFLVVTLLEQKGALDQADEKLSTLLRRNTSNEDAESIARNNRVFWAHAGMVRQRLGRYQEAADAFGEAANAGKEKDASLVTYRIDSLISAKAFDKALKEARVAKL